MKLIEERISQLESRVKMLENKVQVLQDENHNIIQKDSLENNEKIIENYSDEYENTNDKLFYAEDENIENDFQHQSLIKTIKNSKNHKENDKNTRKNINFKRNSNKSSNNSESLFGKYIIGLLASLLVFIGTASFVAIVWHLISPELKLAIISLVGISLTVIGLKMSLSKSGPIPSIILGTGSGITYIAIISSSIIFKIIGYQSSTIICVIYTALLMFSYKYTNLFFTVIIAYIGSYINLIMNLEHAQNHNDMLLILLFITSICFIMLFNCHQCGKVKYITTILLSTFSYLTVFFFGILGTIFNYLKPLEIEFYQINAICVFSIFILKNILYKFSNDEETHGIFFLASVVSTFTTSVFIIFSLSNHFNFSYSQYFMIFLAINLIQIVLNHIICSNIEDKLIYFYMVFIYISILGINLSNYDILSAGAFIMLILILREKLFKKSYNLIIPILSLIIDTILIYSSVNLFAIVYSLINTGIILYILKSIDDDKKSLSIRNIGLVLLIINSFNISKQLFEIIKYITKTANISYYDLSYVLGHIISVIILVLVYKFDFFQVKDKEDENSETVYIKSYLVLNACLTLLYIHSMGLIITTDMASVKFLLSITTLLLCLLKTHMTISNQNSNTNIAYAWLMIKYFVYTWIVLGAFSKLPVQSVVYSVTGLILSVLAIYLGFRYSIKVIRQFGLAIAMLMVAKFIFVDLNGENSITRVVSFVAGGVLCFMISLIYNKLSND